METHLIIHVIEVLIGVILFGMFAGYLFLSVREKSKRADLSYPQQVAGLFSVIAGLVMSSVWIYYAVNAEPFWLKPWSVSFHVGVELVAAIALVIAGIAMLRKWSRGPALFILSNAVLLYSMTLALPSFSLDGHPFAANAVAIVLTILYTYFVGFVFLWEHFVLDLDESLDVEQPQKLTEIEVIEVA